MTPMVNKGVHRVRERVQQGFTQFVPQYQLNKDGKLEEVEIPKDTQAIIDSCEYTSLESMYDYLLELNRQQYAQMTHSDLIEERDRIEDNLQYFRDVDIIREQYAASNPDVANMSHAELKDHIENKLHEAKNAIEAKRKEVIENGKKKNDIEKGEHENVHPNRPKDTPEKP